MRNEFKPISARMKGFNFHSLISLSMFIVSTGIVIALLWVPPNEYLSRRVYAAGLEVVFFISLVFSALLSRRGLFWTWIGFLFTIILFVLLLLYKWQGLGENYFLIGGLLPWSDSYGYYDEAQRLLHGLNLTVWGSRRPIFSAFLSVLFLITNNNLQFVLVILVVLSAGVVYLAAREIQINLKSAMGSAVYIVISLLFYRRFAGTLMTENLGFILGNLALVFLLQGVYQNNIKKLYWGLFVLTIALNVRAGAFFILPILAIWMAYFLGSKFTWWRIFVGAACIIFLGMASNLILLKLIGPSEGAAPFSNFSHTFYGLASGYKGWGQIYKDFPHVREEDIPVLAIQKFKENPYTFFDAIIQSYQGFATASQGAFSFLFIKGFQREFLNLILWILTAIALMFSIIQWKRHRQLGIVLACFLGILFSVGFLPPIDADKMRVYAATIPISAFIISVGVGVPALIYTTYLDGQITHAQGPIPSSQSFALWLSVILLCMTFIVPLFIKQSGYPSYIEKKVFCAPNHERIHFLMGSGSSIKIESDILIQESYVPQLRLSDFQRMSTVHDRELVQALLSLKEGSVLNMGVQIDASTGKKDIRSAFLVLPYILEPGYHDLCVVRSKNELLQTYPFYHDSTIFMNNEQSISYSSYPLIFKARFFYSLILWILFGLFIIDLVPIWRFPAKIVPLVLANTLVVTAGFLMLLHCSGLVPLHWQSISFNTQDAVRVDKFMFSLDLNNTWMSASRLWNYPVRLYENDVELIDSNSPRYVIAAEGNGKFILIDGVLYFSSQDNANPRKDGREYTIVWPSPVRKRYQWLAYPLAMIGLFIHIKYFRRLALSANI